MKSHPDDGKFVVVKGGKRVSGQLHDSQEKAQEEAQKENKLAEGQARKGQPSAEVKQNLYE
jgi:hypothetical protein